MSMSQRVFVPVMLGIMATSVFYLVLGLQEVYLLGNVSLIVIGVVMTGYMVFYTFRTTGGFAPTAIRLDLTNL